MSIIRVKLLQDLSFHFIFLVYVFLKTAMQVVVYQDSPLVSAVRHGRVLVIDEADKAPLEAGGNEMPGSRPMFTVVIGIRV